MEKKSKKEVKAHLEAIAGREIDAATAERLRLYYPVAATSETDGSVKWQSFIVFHGSFCQDASLYDVSGSNATGSDGKVTFTLAAQFCSSPNFADPVNVVATSNTDTPCYVTLQHALVPPPPNSLQNDVQITVYAWDASGKPAPGVSFDWRCRVPGYTIIL